jgi:hypothetical protein
MQPTSSRSQASEAGQWKLETGKWKMETGNWELETGNWKLENGNWKAETGKSKLESGNWPGTLKGGDRWYPTQSSASAASQPNLPPHCRIL